MLMLNLRCLKSCPIRSSASSCNAMGSRPWTSGSWSPRFKRCVQDSRNLLVSLTSRFRGMSKMPAIGLRLCLAIMALMASTTVSGADEASHTCINNGTLVRLAVSREVQGQNLPCTVERLEHPLGLYHLKWRILWRAENQASFCFDKLLENVDNLRAAGWKCMSTKAWQGRE